MSVKSKFLTTAALSFMTLCSTSSYSNNHSPVPNNPLHAHDHAAKDVNEMVKCYGVAKAGQNDCGSADGTHSCAGKATKDNDPCEWKAMKRAECLKNKGTEKPIMCKASIKETAGHMMKKHMDKK